MNHIRQIREALAASECDALMLTGEVNRSYATGFPSTDGLAVITAAKAWYFTDSRYIEAAEQAITDCTVEMVSSARSYGQALADIIREEDIGTIGFEEATMTVFDYLTWKDRIPAEMKPSQKLLTDLRASKSREELAQMIDAQRLAEKAFLEILPLISTDITEKELAAELVYRFLRYGAEDKSFDPIVVSGPRSSMPHGVPTDARIGKGFLTIDFGVKLGGWCSDTTRTLCVGEPTEEMRKVYDTVLRAQQAGIDRARAGLTGKEVDAAARDLIHAEGYGGFFGHGFGHGVGLEIHEAPTLNPGGTTPLPAGAVVSAEPGIYLPGQFGVRIEDVLYLTEEGCEDITNLPRELTIL